MLVTKKVSLTLKKLNFFLSNSLRILFVLFKFIISKEFIKKKKKKRPGLIQIKILVVIGNLKIKKKV